ncbi:MAG: hypothetical protein A3C84_02110 [Candidatus Ryanbacteria bacterium RIFCSPHIGHO2_02_FULL_48_12]|uniref:Uncharacterized protein n=1 Tax=Candidatus Ryanbacteria bacterium RIFCSPHIGHO2_01_FULL_48_27 TaxID=1802115 RepID=A0A1G2G326_9BACT|nr:MAG: hypothetical protein A2756_04540 [Candidatus Ryanbacteria bacterium RIFCSPHIGHO2_01_FULL_48_27]OGZ49247.1 MAG: hypothetical protein A3C84_02110 [Candidatus Ryanbacteria bacterium RIFCSPHIGHO2_02_FULL_48_12]
MALAPSVSFAHATTHHMGFRESAFNTYYYKEATLSMTTRPTNCTIDCFAVVNVGLSQSSYWAEAGLGFVGFWGLASNQVGLYWATHWNTRGTLVAKVPLGAIVRTRFWRNANKTFSAEWTYTWQGKYYYNYTPAIAGWSGNVVGYTHVDAYNKSSVDLKPVYFTAVSIFPATGSKTTSSPYTLLGGPGSYTAGLY